MIEFKSPKEIILTAGGSQLKINGSGIFSTTAAKFEVKAGQHLFTGGENLITEVPLLPYVGGNKFIELNYHYDDLAPIKGAAYKVIFEDGSILNGILDDKGYAKVDGVPEGKKYMVEFGEDPVEWIPPPLENIKPNDVEKAEMQTTLKKLELEYYRNGGENECFK